MNNTSSTLHICYCSDRNLLRQMLVSAQSAFENVSVPIHFHFIISADAETEFHALYRAMQARVPAVFSHFTVYAVTAEMESRLPFNSHLPRASCYRLLVDTFIPDIVSYTFYVDVDTLFTGDIATAPLPVDSLLSAVLDVFLCKQPQFFPPELQDRDHYFNAGVMFINMEQWRTLRIATRAIDLLCKDPEKYHSLDQDALNLLGKGLWTPLPDDWNRLTECLPRASHWFWFLRLHRIFPVTIPKGVIHFASGAKPWKKYCFTPYRFYYWNYFQRFFPDYPLRSYGTLREQLLCWTPNWLYRLYLRLLKRPYTYDFYT